MRCDCRDWGGAEGTRSVTNSLPVQYTLFGDARTR